MGTCDHPARAIEKRAFVAHYGSSAADMTGAWRVEKSATHNWLGRRRNEHGIILLSPDLYVYVCVCACGYIDTNIFI